MKESKRKEKKKKSKYVFRLTSINNLIKMKFIYIKKYIII